MHTSETEQAAEKIFDDLVRGMDAIFGVKCRICGRTVDPATHWHDDDGHQRAEESRASADLQREAGEYQREERGR